MTSIVKRKPRLATTRQLTLSLGVGLLCAAQDSLAAENDERIRLDSLTASTRLQAMPSIPFKDGKTVFGAIALNQQFDQTDLDEVDPRNFSHFQIGFGDYILDLHGGGATTPLSNQLNLGFRLFDTAFNLVSGNTAEAGWRDQALPGFYSGFSNGFDGAAYQWNGITLAQHLTPSLNLRGSHVKIDLQDRVDPMLWQAGIDWRKLSANLYQVRRNDTAIADGLNLSLDLGRFGVGYSEFSDQNSHTLRSAQAAWVSSKHSLLGLQVQQGTSPFNGLEESRVMLRWQYIPGSQWRSDNELMASGLKHGAGYYIKNMAMLGVIVAGAAAVASASTEADGGEGGYATQHEAARAILNEVNPKSVRENREYGGWIFRAKDDTYSYTQPNKGLVDQVSLGDKPRGTTAAYHTHGGENPGYDGENFSATDIRLYERFEIDGYLGTPKGRWKYYQYSAGSVSQIGTVAN